MNATKVTLVGLLALALAGAGMWVGFVVKERAEVRRAETSEKIIAWIVKRNPDASIRDFAGFPDYLQAESHRAGVDFRFVMAVIDKESEWKPTAVSPAGAVGLMQLMPPTAAMVAQKLGASDYEPPTVVKGRYVTLGSLSDPKWSVRLGLTYLRWQMDEYGVGAQSLRAYNRGPSRAKLAWRDDRYAEDVALTFVALAHKIR